MSRNRMIHASFWESETVARWPLVTRLTYIALWNHSDDYGVVKADPTHLHSKCFPWPQDRYIDMKAALKPLVEDGRLQLFKHNDKFYGYITNFLKRQTIQRPSKQHNPKFEKIEEGSLIPHSALNEDRHFVPPAPHTGTVNITRSTQAAQQSDLTAKPLDFAALNEGLVSPHEPLTLKEKLSKVKQPLPTVVVVNPREHPQQQQAKELWIYYSNVRKKAGIEHTPPFASRRDDVFRTLEVEGVSVSDIKLAIDFCATNRNRRFMPDGTDLFEKPTTIFGKQEDQKEKRAARINNLIHDAKVIKAHEERKALRTKSSQVPKNKEIAAKWLAFLESDWDTVLKVLNKTTEGSDTNTKKNVAKNRKRMEACRAELKNGHTFWIEHWLSLEDFQKKFSSTIKELEHEQVKAYSHQARF